MNTEKIEIDQLIQDFAFKPTSIKIWPMDGNAKAVVLNGHPQYFFSFEQPDNYIWLDFVYPNLKLDGIHIGKTNFETDAIPKTVFFQEQHISIANMASSEFKLDLEIDNDKFLATRFSTQPNNWIESKLYHPRELIRTQNYQFTDEIKADNQIISITRFLMYESRILLHLDETAPVSCSKLMTISHNLNDNSYEFTETLIKLSNGMPAYFSKFVSPGHDKYSSLSNSPYFEFDEIEYRMYYESLPLRDFQL